MVRLVSVVEKLIKAKKNVQQSCDCFVHHRRRYRPRELQGLPSKGFDLVCSVIGTQNWIKLSDERKAKRQ